MFEDFALLSTGKLREKTTYIHPERLPEVVHLDSPAKDVFTDFKSRPPETCAPTTLVKEALARMAAAKVKSLLVIDEHDHMIGHISARDCQGLKTTQAAQKHAIAPSEVTADMLMQAFDQLPTLNIKNLSNARVGHIARLLHELGSNYLIVVEDVPGSEEEMIRGLFSISRLSRQLGINLSGDLSAHTVADINRRI